MKRSLFASPRYGLLVVASIALAGLLAACPSRTRLEGADMDALRESYQGQTFYLRQSLYHGRFYDDDHRRLVDAHAFKDLKLMTAPDGEIIIPPPPDGILPAGTRVEVLDVEFPTSGAIVKRPLFTPRYNVWVTLKVGRVSGDLALFKPEEHVWVLPTTVRSMDAIRASLEALLSAEPLDPWLARRSEAARLAIFEKRAEQGLSTEELTAALGLPETLHRSFEGEQRIERALFGGTEVTLVDGVVTEIRDAAPSENASSSSSSPAE
ncbi:MAG: hypothetical protein ABIJ09_23490 [Pseudomonadota bacterium]